MRNLTWKTDEQFDMERSKMQIVNDPMNRPEAEGLAWETFVGSQTPEEFIDGVDDIDAAVNDYVAEIPTTFSEYEYDLEDFHGYAVAELLRGYIESQIEVAVDYGCCPICGYKYDDSNTDAEIAHDDDADAIQRKLDQAHRDKSPECRARNYNLNHPDASFGITACEGCLQARLDEGWVIDTKTPRTTSECSTAGCEN